MLYDLWRSMAQAHGGEIALWDSGSGRRWLFRELLTASETGPLEDQPWVYPQGNSVDFILAVLRGWRSGSVVCPLEVGYKSPCFPPPPSPCCHLKMTSATSGRARAIAFTGHQLVADAENIVATMGLRPEWPNLGAISLAHSYGFSNLVLPLLLHGIPLILAPSPLPEMVKAAALGHDYLTLAGVPALWRGWSEANAIPASVRLAISAGAPLRSELEQSVYNKCGLKIHNFYGSSECGGIAYDHTAVPRSDGSFVGDALSHVDLSVSENDCLTVRSKAVGETCWPESDPAVGNGTFRTADVAEIKNASVFLRGRLGDQINVAGRKVAPETIEAALRLHPGVKDCLVFGVPSVRNDRAEDIVACVVVDGDLPEKDLRYFLQRKLPSWQVPRDWWFVSSLVANERGKISRTEWARKYLEQRANRPSQLS